MAHAFTCLLVVFSIVYGVKSENLCSDYDSDIPCDIEIENTLRTILTPTDYPSLQLQALRKDIMRKLEREMERIKDEEELENYKRSLSSLAAWDNLPGKRNVEALARAGYLKRLPDEDDSDYIKRSLATLIKNGQMPLFQTEEKEKRGIQSLARNGDLNTKRERPEIIEDLYNKRNIGSLARNFNFPSASKRFLGSLARSGDLTHYSFPEYKRNVASLARDGGRLAIGKRNANAAALLRQDSYLNNQNDYHTELPDYDGNKRNIGSVKAQFKQKFKRSVDHQSTRNKRQVNFYAPAENEEYPQPVYQNQNVYDYEELLKALTGVYPNTDKRFLGSVAKTGWFRSPSSSSSRFRSPEKRHIGALARLGWLPTLRNTRRFNRSGRSPIDESDYETCRETSADGETENNSLSEDPISLIDKRYLLQPAVDHILLRKIIVYPRLH